LTDDTHHSFGDAESAQTPTSPFATFLVAVLSIAIAFASVAIALSPFFER